MLNRVFERILAKVHALAVDWNGIGTDLPRVCFRCGKVKVHGEHRSGHSACALGLTIVLVAGGWCWGFNFRNIDMEGFEDRRGVSVNLFDVSSIPIKLAEFAIRGFDLWKQMDLFIVLQIVF